MVLKLEYKDTNEFEKIQNKLYVEYTKLKNVNIKEVYL